LGVSGLRTVIRETLERSGYWVAHRSVLPFGIDPSEDIRRLAARYDVAVDLIFDVGAHVGAMAREYLAAFPAATVHAFEPHPNSCRCLEQIDNPRLRTHELAISDRCGTAEFFVFGDLVDPSEAVAASMNNSLVRDRQFARVDGAYEKSITVQCSTVDAVCEREGIERLPLLKIDTEGHEAAVLDGARETLARRGVRFVFLEFETVAPVADATGGALAPCAERLEPLGFRLVATYPVNMVDQRPLYASFNALFFAA
jgi:FkbM family methyltransferase